MKELSKNAQLILETLVIESKLKKLGQALALTAAMGSAGAGGYHSGNKAGQKVGQKAGIEKGHKVGLEKGHNEMAKKSAVAFKEFANRHKMKGTPTTTNWKSAGGYRDISFHVKKKDK